MEKMIQRKIVSILILFLVSSSLVFAEEKKLKLTAMTTPFGSAGYSLTLACEETFRKADSRIAWQTKETPGAMYIFKYLALNRGKISAGEHTPVIVPIQSGLLRYVKEGWPPFEKIPNPDLRAIFSLPAAVNLLVTFDTEIKTLGE